MTTPRWRPTSLITEVGANLFPPRSRRFPALVAVVLLGLANVAVLTGDWATLRRESRQLTDRGWNVYTLASTDNAIEAQRCRDLARLDGVVRSGSVVHLSDSITPGGILAPVLIDESLLGLGGGPYADGRTLAAQPGARVVEFRGEYREVAPSPVDPSRWSLGAALLFPTQILGPADTCVYELDLSWAAYLDDLPPALVGAVGPPPEASGPALLSPGEHPYRRFLSRPTRWVPLWTGLLAALLYLGVAFSLRNQTAIYLISGMSRYDLWLYLLTEILIITVVSAVVSTTAMVWLVEVTGLDITTSLGMMLPAPMTFIVCSAVAAALIPTGNVHEQLKDR